MFLVCVEIFQALFIMGFENVCSFECVIGLSKSWIPINITFSIIRISWRVSTSFECCSIPENRDPLTLKRQCCLSCYCCQMENKQTFSPEIGMHSTESKLSCSSCSSCSGDNLKKPLILLFGLLLLPIGVAFAPFICTYFVCKKIDCEDCLKENSIQPTRQVTFLFLF